MLAVLSGLSTLDFLIAAVVISITSVVWLWRWLVRRKPEQPIQTEPLARAAHADSDGADNAAPDQLRSTDSTSEHGSTDGTVLGSGSVGSSSAAVDGFEPGVRRSSGDVTSELQRGGSGSSAMADSSDDLICNFVGCDTKIGWVTRKLRGKCKDCKRYFCEKHIKWQAHQCHEVT